MFKVYILLQRFGAAAERAQRKAANYLNAKAAGLGRGQMIGGLAVFCLLFGSGSAVVIWQSLKVAAIGGQPLTVPGHAILPGEAEGLAGSELARLRGFRHYLDSLRGSESGKACYDSLVRRRPGLLDSLAFIEQVYPLQLKISEDGNEK